MNKISLQIGSKVYCENKQYEITKQISTKEILAKEIEFPYVFKVLKIQNLKSEPENSQEIDISLYDEKEWEDANKKYEIIKPLLTGKRNTKKVVITESEVIGAIKYLKQKGVTVNQLNVANVVGCHFTVHKEFVKIYKRVKVDL